jgi:hypothetical protein
MKTWLFGEKVTLLFSPNILQGAKPSKVASLLLYVDIYYAHRRIKEE